MTQQMQKKGRGRPRRSGAAPYCHHKASGQAYVNLGGQAIYLGPHNSPESLQKYSTLIAEYAVCSVVVVDAPSTQQQITAL